MKTYNKPWLYVKSGLMLILCWLISIPIVTFCATFYNKFGVIMALLFGFCSVGATVCLFADSALKLGKNLAHYDERANNGPVHKNFGVNYGMVPTAISYIEVLLVFLSKFELIDFDFYPIYKTLNIYFTPFTYIFSPNIVENIDGKLIQTAIPAAELSAAALAVIAVLPLVFIITTTVAYNIGYKNIDVKQKILYGK